MLLAWDYSDLKVNIPILIFDDQIADCILWPMMRIMGMKEWKDIVVDLVDEALVWMNWWMDGRIFIDGWITMD